MNAAQNHNAIHAWSDEAKAMAIQARVLSEKSSVNLSADCNDTADVPENPAGGLFCKWA